MKTLGLFATLACTLVYAAPQKQDKDNEGSVPGLLVSSSEFVDWFEKERAIAFERMMDNVGGYGKEAQGVLDGVPVASPSRENPDYWYVWTRDSGIVIETMIDGYVLDGASNDTLANVAKSYITSSGTLQHVDNLSGTFANLSGLGEPKFYVNGTAFNGDWGRPQRDGPGLRAVSIIDFFDAQVNAGKNEYSDFQSDYDDVLLNDLEYVVRYWQEPGFDIWEEVQGFHLYTQVAQMRAMSQGAALAEQLGDSANAELFRATADDISVFIRSKFYNETVGRMAETIECPWDANRGWLDAATVIAANDVARLANTTLADQAELYPWTPRVLRNLHDLVFDMRDRYTVNANRLSQFESAGRDTNIVGTAVGRYPEDVYNGTGSTLGNPWFLTTAAIAEGLYRVVDYYASQPASFKLDVSADNGLAEPFFAQFLGDNAKQQISRNSSQFRCLLQKLLWYADSFLEVLKEHMDQDTGAMSEQFNRDTGYLQGAHDLTWSYGAFWSTAATRDIALSHHIDAPSSCRAT